MARRPVAADPPSFSRIGRFLSALRQGAAAFRAELNNPLALGVNHIVGNRSHEDPYTATIRAIEDMGSLERRTPRLRVDKNAVAAARHFVGLLRSKNMPVPDVGPSPDHGVAMSWSFETPKGSQFEVDVVIRDWKRIEYREGFAERDGFEKELTLGDTDEVRERVLRAMQTAQRVA